MMIHRHTWNPPKISQIPGYAVALAKQDAGPHHVDCGDLDILDDPKAVAQVVLDRVDVRTICDLTASQKPLQLLHPSHSTQPQQKPSDFKARLLCVQGPA